VSSPVVQSETIWLKGQQIILFLSKCFCSVSVLAAFGHSGGAEGAIQGEDYPPGKLFEREEKSNINSVIKT